MPDAVRHESAAWIDIHAHVRPLAGAGGVDPALHGAAQGVGILVDAGSAPPADLERLLADADPSVHAWANICAEGIAGSGCRDHDISGRAAAMALERLPGRVVGIKLQASRTRLADRSMAAIASARVIGDRFGVPLLVHVGNGPPTIREVAAALRPGDIITHFAHGKPLGALEGDRPHPALIEARARGVLFDLGHGASSFSFSVMERLLDAGFAPDTISTDLHRGSANRPVGSLADCMSKLLGLGMSLEAVVQAVTDTPARALRLRPPGLRTRFRVDEAGWEAVDSYGERRRLDRRLTPTAAPGGPA